MIFKDLAKHFTESFDEYMPVLQEHIDFNGEVLNHVFFGECIEDLVELIGKEKDLHKIKALFDTCRIWRFKGFATTAYKYMGAETRKSSEEIEKFWVDNEVKEEGFNILGTSNMLNPSIFLSVFLYDFPIRLT